MDKVYIAKRQIYEGQLVTLKDVREISWIDKVRFILKSIFIKRGRQ